MMDMSRHPSVLLDIPGGLEEAAELTKHESAAEVAAATLEALAAEGDSYKTPITPHLIDVLLREPSVTDLVSGSQPAEVIATTAALAATAAAAVGRFTA